MEYSLVLSEANILHIKNEGKKMERQVYTMSTKDDVIQQQNEEIKKLQQQLKTATKPSTLISVFKENIQQGIHHFFHREAKMKDMEKENKKLKEKLESKEEELNRTNAELTAAIMFQKEDQETEKQEGEPPAEPLNSAVTSQTGENLVFPQTQEAAIKAYFKGVDLQALARELYPNQGKQPENPAATDMPMTQSSATQETGQKTKQELAHQPMQKPAQDEMLINQPKNEKEYETKLEPSAEEETLPASTAAPSMEGKTPSNPDQNKEQTARPDTKPEQVIKAGRKKENEKEKQEETKKEINVQAQNSGRQEKQKENKTKQPADEQGSAVRPKAETKAETKTSPAQNPAAAETVQKEAASQKLASAQKQEPGKKNAKTEIKKEPSVFSDSDTGQENAPTGTPRVSIVNKNGERINRKDGRRQNNNPKQTQSPAETAEEAVSSPKEDLPESFGIVMDEPELPEAGDIPEITNESVFDTTDEDWDDSDISG